MNALAGRETTHKPVPTADREPFTARRLLLLVLVALFALAAAEWLDIPARREAAANASTVEVRRTHASHDGGALHVSLTFESEQGGEFRAWYYLATPGDPEPWRDFEYMSEVRQVALAPGESLTLDWWEEPNVRDGRYEITAWIHQFEHGGWVHSAGGAYEFGEFAVRGHGLRFRELHGGAAARVLAPHLEGERLVVPLRPTEPVAVYWAFHPPGDHEQVLLSGGEAVLAGAVELELVPPGGSGREWDLVVIAAPRGESTRAPQIAHFYGASPVTAPPAGDAR